MNRARTITMLIGLTIALLAPAATQAKAGPTSSLTKPASCSTLVYTWTGFRKAASATFKLHHNGIYQDQATVTGIGATGSLVIPAALSGQMLADEHYTVLAVLNDGSGRAIQPSPAAWYGYC